MATDTLSIAEALEKPGDGAFSGAQARRLAHALIGLADDKRLKDVEVRLGVLSWIIGLQLAVTLSVLWLVFNTNAQVARVDQRVTGLEQRVITVEQRLVGVEQRLGGVEERLGGVEQQLSVINDKLDRLLSSPAR